MASITIAELLIEIGVDVKDANAAQKKIDGLKTGTKELGEAAEKSDKKTKSFAKGLGKNLAIGAAAAAAAIVAAASAIFNFVNETTAAIDATAKLARALGLPIEELQRLEFAAGQSGLEGASLQAGIKKLNAGVLELQNGVGAAVEPLGDLGLKFEDLEKLTTTEQLGLIGERLQEVGDASERSAISALIFGQRAGPEMASLLAEGSDGLAALGAEAKNVVTQEDAARAEEFQNRIGELTSFVDGLTQTIALELLPPIMEVIEQIQAWTANNEELIGGGLDVFLNILATVWEAVTSEIKILIAIVKTILGFFGDLIGKSEFLSKALEFLTRIVTFLFNPLNSLIDTIELVILGMEKLGLVSEGTADRFGASVDKMVNDAAGFDTIANKASAARVEVDSLAEAQEDQERIRAAEDEGNFGMSFEDETPAERRRRLRAERRLHSQQAVANAAAKGGRGGGGSRKTPKKKVVPKKKTTSSVTVGEIIARLGQGDPTALAEDIRGLDARTPAVRDIQPTVAVTFIQNVFEAGAFDIKSSDPAGSAREVGAAISAALQSAGESLTSPIVR